MTTKKPRIVRGFFFILTSISQPRYGASAGELSAGIDVSRHRPAICISTTDAPAVARDCADSGPFTS